MNRRWTTALSLACLAFLSWHFTQVFWQVSHQAFTKIKHEIKQELHTPPPPPLPPLPPSPTCQVEQIKVAHESNRMKGTKKKTILIIHRF